MERRLVTILAADAAGYSRLVADDEDAALAFFKRCSAVIIKLLKAHHGRVFGGSGDSVVCEFSSPVEALRSAVEIQHELETINAPLPEEKRMRFRIGLNLGDAVVAEGNLLGEAVNVAARLEGLADPGGICISGSLHEQVKHLPDFGFRDLGSRALKNIPFQVHAYAVDVPGSRRQGKRVARWAWPAAAAVLTLVALPAAWKFFYDPQSMTALSQPSIAVLPLENLSGDASQEYFSDGLTQDITTDLSRFSNLFVIASNSAFTFKDKPAKAQDIGYKLGARYLLEGTVQKTPDRLRVNAQLIDAESGNHVWAQRYDRGLGDVFVVQEEMIRDIVTALAVKVNAAELQRVSRIDTRNMDAYEYYLQAKRVLNDLDKWTPEGNDETRRLLEKSIELDPNFSKPYGLLSYVYIRAYQNDWDLDRAAALKKAEDFARKELALADSFDGHWSIAIVYSNQGEFDKSLHEYKTALSLNPNDPDLLAEMGEALVYGGEIEAAKTQIEEAIRRNVETPDWYFWNYGRAQYMAKEYQAAIATIAKMNDPPIDVLLITAASKAQLGMLDEARADIAKFSAGDPEWSIAKSAEYYYKNDSDRQHWLDGLRKAGLKEK